MDKTVHMSWADYSEDESSETEEALPLLDPIQQQIIDSINQSKESSYQFKIENLPYQLTGPEEIFTFLSLAENEAEIRLQFKGKKFCGFALVSTEFKEVALKVAFKYGNSFDTRPVLIYYKPSENAFWIPQKNQIPNTSLSQTGIFEKSFLEKDEKKKSLGKAKKPQKGGQKSDIMKDPAILSAVQSRSNRRRW